MAVRKQRLVPGKLRGQRQPKVLVESEALAAEVEVEASNVIPLDAQPSADIPERTDHGRADRPRGAFANDHEVRARLRGLADGFRQEHVHVRYCVRFMNALEALEREMVQLDKEAVPLMRSVSNGQ